jgi:hypothetical protein
VAFYFGKKELKILLERSLSKREKEILLAISKIQRKTFSSAVKSLSKEYPESTLKFVIRWPEQKGLDNLWKQWK